MQTEVHVPGGPPPSFIRSMRTAVASHGFRSLYTGLSASIMRQMSYSLVRLGAYENFKSRLSQNYMPSTMALLAVAGGAGLMGGIAGNPAGKPSNIILVRMTSDVLKPPDKRYNYPNVFSGLFSIVKKDGLRGLVRGMTPNLARAFLMNPSQVGSYDLIKTSLLGKSIPTIQYRFQDNLMLHTICIDKIYNRSFTEDLKAICSPADVVRSRMMSSAGGHGVIHVLTTSLRNEGPRFLFKGWTPAFIRLGPNTVFLFVFYEQLKKGWRILTFQS
ncbi:mitochondrial carrier [Fistulina hepatica ATCC 64428]|uniref:Mitochondrial carrier n=1 Tax=Fistulina hepatica ATCC 64428 TaxID=1128425 RepID=A0A0D7A329_9AGAR|nr:mitochondrial carrier [Fistulina hepatica ATCC 64428]